MKYKFSIWGNTENRLKTVNQIKIELINESIQGFKVYKKYSLLIDRYNLQSLKRCTNIQLVLIGFLKTYPYV